MTCGIYALYWEYQDKVYIGLSQNIEGRFKEHLRDMRKGDHSNYLIQKIYNEYGEPNTLVILEECSLLELNNKEIYWTNEFDALNPKVGLCLVEPGNNVFGTRSRNSKYSKRQVLSVFSMLYKTTDSHRSISNKLKVPISLVDDIACRGSHLWLKEQYTEKYNRLVANKPIRYKLRNTSEHKDKHYPTLVSPTGEEFDIVSITDFCTNNFSNSSLRVAKSGILRVLNKDRKSYLGWRLK